MLSGLIAVVVSLAVGFGLGRVHSLAGVKAKIAKLEAEGKKLLADLKAKL